MNLEIPRLQHAMPTSLKDSHEIHELSTARGKIGGEFSIANKIQRELNQNGVEVDDGRRIWRVDGMRFKESGRAARQERSSRQQQPQGEGTAPNVENHKGLLDRFGPLGHDYNFYPRSKPKTFTLSDDRIHNLLSHRLATRLTQNFDAAD